MCSGFPLGNLSHDLVYHIYTFLNISELADDCQPNAIPDSVDIAKGTSYDLNSNGTPDECEPCILAFNPPDGAIDARQPKTPDGKITYGISSIEVGNDSNIYF